MKRVVALLAGLALSSPALADEPAPRTLRVLGEVTSPAKGVPDRFVIDAVLQPDGDDPFKTRMEGWLATLGETPKGDDIEGSCVEARCAITVDLGYDKLSISADLAGPTPGSGRAILTDEDGRREAQVRFTPITGPVAGLGVLAAPDAVLSNEMNDLLLWNGGYAGFSNDYEDEPIGWMQRGALRDWQGNTGRPGAGLVLVDDLAKLRADAKAAKAASGWTRLEGQGWTAGYPAAVLTKAETVGTERRFSSADGKRVLVIAIDPPVGEAGWDAFVDKMTSDRPGVERHGYTRVNDDMEINWEEQGRHVYAAYHSRKGGLARVEYSTPVVEEIGEPDFTAILPRALVATDDLAPR
jgi:hypothetical protein